MLNKSPSTLRGHSLPNILCHNIEMHASKPGNSGYGLQCNVCPAAEILQDLIKRLRKILVSLRISGKHTGLYPS